MSELHELLEAVRDQATFRDFAIALKDDFIDSSEQEKLSPSSPYGNAANGWANITIDHFLDGGIAGALDDRGSEGGTEPNNLWRRFAEFLYCGKVYE